MIQVHKVEFKKVLHFVINQIVGSQNLEESSLAVKRISTGTGDLFNRGKVEGTGNSSVIKFYSEIHYILFYFLHLLVTSLIIAFCIILLLPLEVQKM
jgi:hypothetical protein